MFLKNIRKYFKNVSGVAATEFAMISPIFILMLVGVVDYGTYMNEKMRVENAARTTVDFMVKGGDEEDVVELILASYYPQEFEDDVGLTMIPVETTMICECAGGEVVDCNDGVCEDDDYLRRYYNTTVTRTHNTLFPYPGIDSTIELEGHARVQLD